MSSPFVLEEHNKKYTVTWPTFHDVRTVDGKINLCRVLFDELKNDHIGLLCEIGNKKYTMYIDFLSFVKIGEVMESYALDKYRVAGVEFQDLLSAEKFLEFLEKKYIWRLLKA